MTTATPLIAACAVVLVGMQLRIHVGRIAELRPPIGGRPTRRRALRLMGRRRRIEPRAVADWCDELARRVRAGASLRAAISDAVPSDERLADETSSLRLAARRGRPLTEALGKGTVDRHVQVAYVVLGAIAELGGSPALALDRAATTLRVRAADADERAVHTAQARMSGHVLTALPLTMLVLLSLTDPDVRQVILTAPGVGCLAAGGALNAAGWWWMHRLTRTP